MLAPFCLDSSLIINYPSPARMRLWLSKNSEVPLREQLVTQIILGVASNDLKPEERLPSTRDLARRYKIHSNTVSAAYRELDLRGWVEFRKGSGVYVRARHAEQELEGELELDQLISIFFKTAREEGHSLSEIQSGLRRWSARQPPDHFLLIEPDAELRRILVAEIEAAAGARVVGVGIDEYATTGVTTGAVPVAMYGQAEQVRTKLRPGADLIAIRSQSVPESLSGQTLPPGDALIAVVSCWPELLRRSRAILVAAGLDPDALSFHDARERRWKNGLRSAAFVITDSLMASRLPPGCTARIFRIISDSSIEELRYYVEQFFD
jgi:DNA-binding transcriptional regulator YhcF (GntR family)